MSSAAISVGTPNALLTVSRGLRVLRAFRSDRSPLTNAELVRRTGLPKATVSRLTSTLLQLGFVQHVPGSREFELATGALGMGHALVASSELLRESESLLQKLADRLGVSVALATADDLDMLYVAYRASHRVATLRLGTGSVLPMGTTSIGHAYLWGLPTGQRHRLIARLKTAAGPKAAGALLSRMEQSFCELASGGTCGVLGGYQRDAFGIGLPVRIGREQVVMGLSCGKADVQPDVVAERRRITPVLKAAAVQLEERMADFESL